MQKNKDEYKEYLENADKGIAILSKLKGDQDVIAALLSLMAGVMIRQAQYELEKEETR